MRQAPAEYPPPKTLMHTRSFFLNRSICWAKTSAQLAEPVLPNPSMLLRIFSSGMRRLFAMFFQDAQISLMSDEVAEIVERIASLFQQAFGIFRHVRARLYEDVFAFGHTDSPVARTQLDAFRAFAERTERLGVNLQHFVVLFMYAFVRNKTF